MRQYWQFEYLSDFGKKTRFFYGTEAAVQRRVKRYQGDDKNSRPSTEPKPNILKWKKSTLY